MKRLLSVFLLTVFCLLIFGKPAVAKIGVGIGTGKIQIDEKLKPGQIYQLPPITILNTGDEAAEYSLSITYHEKQPQLAPPQSWFIFSPATFKLEPNEPQLVKVTLNLPLRIVPGDYFAYLEGHPIKAADTNNNTTIGIAAAAKLYFTVEPASLVQGAYYKAASFWKIYSPWTNRAAILVGLVIMLIVFKRFFNFQINMKKSKPNKDGGPQIDE